MLQDIDITIERSNGEITAIRRQITQLEKEMAYALCNRGMAFLKKGDYKRANIDFGIALKGDPSYAKAYYHRGVLYLHLKEWIKAKQDFSRARRGKVDIAHLFDEDFGGVVAFQQEQKFELPSDIVHLLKDG